MSTTENSLPDGEAMPHCYRAIPAPGIHDPYRDIPTICGRCGGIRGDIEHDPAFVAAYSLERIADRVDELAKIDAGGIMGMLFGGKKG